MFIFKSNKFNKNPDKIYKWKILMVKKSINIKKLEIGLENWDKVVMDLHNRNRFILIVEDNPNDAELITIAFKNNKILNEIVIVDDGQKAIEFLHNTKINPSIILLDIKLPKLNGFEVLKFIRNNTKTKYIPVIILTSSDEKQDITKGYELGANSFIVKPVDFNQFQESIKTLGIYWMLINEPK